MDSTVACRAQRDQVFLCVGSRMAAEFPVMRLKIRNRATQLTPPSVATQDLLTQARPPDVPAKKSAQIISRQYPRDLSYPSMRAAVSIRRIDHRHLALVDLEVDQFARF